MTCSLIDSKPLPGLMMVCHWVDLQEFSQIIFQAIWILHINPINKIVFKIRIHIIFFKNSVFISYNFWNSYYFNLFQNLCKPSRLIGPLEKLMSILKYVIFSFIIALWGVFKTKYLILLCRVSLKTKQHWFWSWPWIDYIFLLSEPLSCEEWIACYCW